MKNFQTSPLVMGIIGGILASILLSGCKLTPRFLIKKHPKFPWRELALPLAQVNQAKTAIIKTRGEGSGKISLYSELIDGYECGALEWNSRDGSRQKFPDCWKEPLADVSEIRWPSGEKWIILVWDNIKVENRRTLTLFVPGEKDLFSCELKFSKDKDSESEVAVDFSFSLGLSQNRKYRDFLDSVKGGYADKMSLGKETRGLKLLRQGEVASTTFLEKPRLFSE